MWSLRLKVNITWGFIYLLAGCYSTAVLCCPSLGPNSQEIASREVESQGDLLRMLVEPPRAPKAKLTSKRSLESQLWKVLSPLDKQLTVAEEVVKVQQDGDLNKELEEILPSSAGEKRYSPYPYNEYLFWMRSGECPQREDGGSEFFCPSPDATTGRWVCVNDAQLCDQMRDCPNGEDELPVHCLFYNVIQTHITRLTQSLLWNSRERGF